MRACMVIARFRKTSKFVYGEAKSCVTAWKSLELEEGEGRRKVVNRKQNDNRAKRRNHEELNKVAITFFVSNLPRNCTSRMLWKALMNYGNIVDAYVLEKKDRAGEVFAFVRFIRVMDVAALECSLNKVTMEGRKLKVWPNMIE